MFLFAFAALGTQAAMVAKVGETAYETLDEAITDVQDGETIVVNAGEYKLNGNLTYTGKAFTIQAAEGAKVSFDMSAPVALSSAKITFAGVTFDYKTNGDYIGLQHTDTLVYNDCTVNGKVFLYAASETFNRCTFVQEVEDYNVWTYGAKSVTFNGCTFKNVGKTINAYIEGNNALSEPQKIEMADCTVESSKSNKAVVNIKNKTQAYDITLTGKNEVSGIAVNETTKSAWYQVETTDSTDQSCKAVSVTEVKDDGTKDVVYVVKPYVAAFVTVTGIAGFADRKFASFAEAYVAIKPTIETLGLGEESATADAFDALFTSVDANGNATLTYTISGTVVYDETDRANLLTMGRKASHYGNGRHLINFKFVGATGKDTDTLTVNSNITLPYEWWGEKTTTGIHFENLTITGSAPSGLYPSQPFFEGIDFSVSKCALKGIKIYNCSNVEGSYTITDSVLDGTGAPADSYAIHLQGNEKAPLSINIKGNTISGYDRGINIDQKTAVATIERNTISVKDAGRSCIQLSSLATADIVGNTLELTGGNAITLHENLLTLSAAPKVSISGNTVTGTGYLIYDDAKANDKEFTSDNLKLTYATDNTVAETVDTTKGVKGSTAYITSTAVNNEVQHYVAQVGTTGYTTLAAAIAALSAENHTLTLLKENAWDAATPVYWAAGTQSGYAATLTEALTAAYKANAGAITIVCRPSADVGTMTHGHVADDLTIYGNKAYLSGGECDLEVDQYKYSRATGAQAADGAYLEKDITITAYELDNLGVWGERHTAHKVTVNLTDCDGKALEGKTNVQRVYISGTTGVNDITLTDCDFLTKATAVYSNADGAIKAVNCSFTDGQVPFNINHKANGKQTVAVENCTFTNCGDAGDWKQFAAPLRLVNSGAGTQSAEVKGCAFAGTVGENGDILLGDGRTGQASNDVALKVTDTAANIKAQKPGYYKDGTVDETKMATVVSPAEGTLETSVAKLLSANDGSEAHPYSREQFAAMTRAEYIAAQGRLGGTLYVNVGDYTYEKDGVLGNGVRDDTTGQVPDHSELNAYGENGYLGGKNDGANGHAVVFVGGTITSGVTGYTSIDNIGTSLLLAVPAYTKVTFKETTFKNVLSFDYQLYTSPWSQLGGLTFNGCTFDGIIVGAIASQELAFNGCKFNNYENTTSANNSNPTWIRPAYGNWTKDDNEGQGTGFRSLTKITFADNTVTSTRPVKFERIAQWEMATTVTATNNTFAITPQEGDKDEKKTKNVGLYFGANAKFDLVIDKNKKSGETAALYTAVYSAPTEVTYVGLPAGSTVKNAAGEAVVTGDGDALAWKTTDKITLKTTEEVASVTNATGVSVNFATLADAIAAAQAGETVTLLADVTVAGQLVAEKALTLDLGGKTVTSTYAIPASLSSGEGRYALLTKAPVTVKNGTFAAGQARALGAYANLTLTDAAVTSELTGGHCCVAFCAAGGTYTVANATIKGDYAIANFAHNATIAITGSALEGSGCGLYHNGSYYGLKLTVSDTTINGAIDQAIGEGKDPSGVYLSGSLDVLANAENQNGAKGRHQATFTRCTIKGNTGVEVKYTDLTLEDCTVVATTEVPSYKPNNNGMTALGFAVVSTDNAKGKTTPKPEGTITITGADGSYTGLVGLGSLDSVKTGFADFEDAHYAVSGGTFSDAVLPEYCAAGFIPTANDDGTYGVKAGAYVAAIGTTGYETLEAALVAAQAGETVTLLADITLASKQSISKELTLDLNGKTLTGTAYQTLSLGSGANVTIQDSSAEKTGKVANGYKGRADPYTICLDGYGAAALTLVSGTVEANPHKTDLQSVAINTNHEKDGPYAINIRGGKVFVPESSTNGRAIVAGENVTLTVEGGEIVGGLHGVDVFGDSTTFLTGGSLSARIVDTGVIKAAYGLRATGTASVTIGAAGGTADVVSVAGIKMDDDGYKLDVPAVTVNSGTIAGPVYSITKGTIVFNVQATSENVLRFADDTAAKFLPSNLELRAKDIDGKTMYYVAAKPDAAYVAVTLGDEKKEMPFPYDWLAANIGADAATWTTEALEEKAANGLAKWQCYLFGLDPSKEDAKVVATAGQGTNEAIPLTVANADASASPLVTGGYVTVAYVLMGSNDRSNDGTVWTQVATSDKRDGLAIPLTDTTYKFYRVDVTVTSAEGN